MQIGNWLKVGIGVLTAPLLSINIINSLVNRITGGRINRDTLAMNAFRGLGGIGSNYLRGLNERNVQAGHYQPRYFR